MTPFGSPRRPPAESAAASRFGSDASQPSNPGAGIPGLREILRDALCSRAIAADRSGHPNVELLVAEFHGAHSINIASP